VYAPGKTIQRAATFFRVLLPKVGYRQRLRVESGNLGASLPEAAALAFVAEHGGCAEPPDTCECPEDIPNP